MSYVMSLADAHRTCAECIREALERDDRGPAKMAYASRKQLEASLPKHIAGAREQA